MLSSKGKDVQFNELSREIERHIRETKNQLAAIEKARIEIRHLSVHGQVAEARVLLLRYRDRFTGHCVQNLESEISFQEATKNV